MQTGTLLLFFTEHVARCVTADVFVIVKSYVSGQPTASTVATLQLGSCTSASSKLTTSTHKQILTQPGYVVQEARVIQHALSEKHTTVAYWCEFRAMFTKTFQMRIAAARRIKVICTGRHKTTCSKPHKYRTAKKKSYLHCDSVVL